jgi:pantothenate synthetase
MSIHPDTHERITKLQKDVEEIKEELEDEWHEKRSTYEERVRKTLEGDKNVTVLYLEIDSVRSLREIEKDLAARQNRIPTMSLWRASKRLLKNGLIKKVGVKGKSPIFAKKPWARALDIDGYVRTKILQQEKSSD